MQRTHWWKAIQLIIPLGLHISLTYSASTFVFSVHLLACAFRVHWDAVGRDNDEAGAAKPRHNKARLEWLLCSSDKILLYATKTMHYVSKIGAIFSCSV